MVFDWTWTADDLHAFTSRVGWQLEDLDKRPPTINTDLDINRTDVMVFLDNTVLPGRPRPIKQIWFYYADVVDDPAVKPLLLNAFDDLVQRAFDLVGQRPTEWWSVPGFGVRWDLPNLVLTLTVGDGSGNVALVSPAYQAWRDEIDAQLDPEETPDVDHYWPWNR